MLDFITLVWYQEDVTLMLMTQQSELEENPLRNSRNIDI